jgi:RES domain-containing protein
VTRHLWRISNHRDLTGRGGLLASGRWHRRGSAVVYCSDHPSTTLLEILVHADLADLPAHYTLLKIACPDAISIHRIDRDSYDTSDLEVTQALGTGLLQDRQFCLIDVPSVVMPQARNVLINPQHPDAGKISIETVFQYPFDSRLLR